jgi:hypothetical protein
VAGDVRVTGTAQIEYGSVRPALSLPKIACHKKPHVLGQGNTQFAGTFARTALHLAIERDLGSRHHDATFVKHNIMAAGRVAYFAAAPGELFVTV